MIYILLILKMNTLVVGNGEEIWKDIQIMVGIRELLFMK